MKSWIIAAGAAAVIAPLVFWVFDRTSVLDYGPPGAVYLRPVEGQPEETLELHFDKITWLRRCPTYFHYYIIDADKKRSDYEPHHTHPEKLGPVQPKWRPFRVPALPKGEATIYPWANSECLPLGYWWPIRIDLPPIKFTVK
jgi:hypothetical protein